MPSAAITHFLDGAIHSRIGIRLIAEQHLALTHAHETGASTNAHSVGIIDTKVNAADLIDACAAFVGDLCESTLGVKPAMVLEGDRSVAFVGVSSHLVSFASNGPLPFKNSIVQCSLFHPLHRATA